jgi:hypothetical protein
MLSVYGGEISNDTANLYGNFAFVHICGGSALFRWAD